MRNAKHSRMARIVVEFAHAGKGLEQSVERGSLRNAT